MVLLLNCVAMTTSFEDAESPVGTIGAVSFVLVFLAISGIAFDIYRCFVPSPFYQYFVCHAKAEAATQARFKRLLLVQRTQQSCFLDTDDLENLYELLDIVKWRIGRLVVYLTSNTFKRPWCAGEVTITHKMHQQLVPVCTSVSGN